MSTWNSIMRSQNQGSLGLADAWLVLQTLPGMTPERLNRLTEAFPNPADVFEAPPDVVARLCGRKAREVLEKESPFDLAAKIRQEASKLGAEIITRDSGQYPETLHEIYAPPGAFFTEGEILAADSLAVAIVGMRRPTDYGRRVARELAAALARKGVTIVSGMAYGIDAEAHRATLDAGGRTIAVLGCGLTQNYPADHKELRQEIAANGAVVSEFHLRAHPRKENFPRRNRLISGLSLATVVVEAAQRSGALLTARLALEQGREVMAVPGPVHTQKSAGCHRLLKEGAHLVENVDDILNALPEYTRSMLDNPAQIQVKALRPEKSEAEAVATAAPHPNLTDDENALLRLLENGDDTIEGLTRQRGLPAQEVSSALLRLELEGLVRQTNSGMYERIPS